MKLWSYAILVILFCALLYPIVANWVWNPNGWLAAKGFNDFAGSAAVHAMGGAGEIGQVFIRRIGDSIDRDGVAAGKNHCQHGGHAFHCAKD